MKKRQILIIFYLSMIFLTMGAIPVMSTSSTNNSNPPQYDPYSNSNWRLAVQIFNLTVDGSITPQWFNISIEMDYLASILFELDWTSNDIFWGKFGNGNGTDALVNGTLIYRDGIPASIPLVSNDALIAGTINWVVAPDTRNPKENHLAAEYQFYNYLPPYGIKMGTHTFGFLVRDNIPLFADSFQVICYGLRYDELAEQKPATNNPTNPFILFQQAFIWLLTNFWVPILGAITIGSLIFIVRKM